MRARKVDLFQYMGCQFCGKPMIGILKIQAGKTARKVCESCCEHLKVDMEGNAK